MEGDTVTFTITGKFGDQEMKLRLPARSATMRSEAEVRGQGGGGGGNGPIEWIAKEAVSHRTTLARDML